MSKLLDLLLQAPDVSRELPTKKVRIKRLSKLLGKDVVFTLRALPYGRVEDVKGMESGADIAILLSGLVDPNPKDEALNQHFNAVTPAEMLKQLLLPGEIDDLSREVERLSGYRTRTIEEIKNDSGAETTKS